MPNWADITRSVLRELGGEQTLVPGAKLKQHIIQSADDPDSFDSFLATQGRKFADWLGTLEAVIVYRRIGTDMLVGFSGAAWPQERTTAGGGSDRPQLRKDVYTALTQVNAGGYFYSPRTDTFSAGPVEETDAIRLPPVTLANLIDERRVFIAEAKDVNAKNSLQNALDFNANPLAAFQRAVVNHHLSHKWHSYKFGKLLSTLQQWAADNDLEMRSEWYDDKGELQRQGPQQLLTKLIPYMSDEEIRNLHVPLHAIERWYGSEWRRHRSA